MKFHVFLRIVARNPHQLTHGTPMILADVKRAAFRIQSQDANFRTDHRKSAFLKLQFARNAPEQGTGRMGNCRTSKSGRQLLGDCRSANDSPALQYQRSKPGPGQIACGHQTVMPSTNHDDGLSLARHYRLQSLKIFRAAFSPDAPIMPPPGCVAEPHM